MLSSPNVFLRPREQQKRADEAKSKFTHIDGSSPFCIHTEHPDGGLRATFACCSASLLSQSRVVTFSTCVNTITGCITRQRDLHSLARALWSPVVCSAIKSTAWACLTACAKQLCSEPCAGVSVSRTTLQRESKPTVLAYREPFTCVVT